MRFVLDSNAVSALMKDEPAVHALFLTVPFTRLGIPQPALAETLHGIERLPSSKRRRAYEASLAHLLTRIVRLPWTDDVTAHFAASKASLEKRGTPLEDFDIAIAAHALSLNAALVTRNVAHMERVPGLRVETW